MNQTLTLFIRGCLLALCLLTNGLSHAQSAGCSGTDPGGAPAAQGLYAEYYAGFFGNNQAFFANNNPGLSRIDAQVNFTTLNWGAISPPATLSNGEPNNYSVRLRGSIVVPTSGRYTFYLTSDDAAYLWLGDAALDVPARNNRVTIDNGGQHSATTESATVFLTAGLHNILIHYGEAAGDNELRLEWASADAGLAREVVPSTAFCTSQQPLRNPPTALTYSPASVTQVTGLGATSPVPTVTSTLPVQGFALLNGATLPAGISLNTSNGVITADASVQAGLYSVDVAVFNADGVLNQTQAFTFSIAAVPPSGCTGTDPGGAAPARGLYAEYYSGFFNNNQAFFVSSTPSLRRVDAQVNFTTQTWGSLAPAVPDNDQNNYSLRLRGSLAVPTTGLYKLYLTSDDAAYLWLGNAALDVPARNDRVTIDNGGLHSAKTDSATVFLTAGLNSILIHYGEGAGDNMLRLEWASAAAGIARQVVPSTAFCTALQPVRNSPTALVYSPGSVSQVAGRVATSPVPTVTSALPVQGFALLNAEALPAGISLNTSTGVITAGPSVPEGRYLADVAVYNAEGALEQRQAFTIIITPTPPPGCSGFDPGSEPVVAGFYAEFYAGYFDDELDKQAYFTINTPVITRIDPQLSFDRPDKWGNLTGASTGPADNPRQFSARFRGSVFVPADGEYTFYLTSDDASYLWLDNAALAAPPLTEDALINNGTGHPPRTITGTTFLTRGLHNILIHYGQFTGDSYLTLEWSSAAAGIQRQLVPTAALCSGVQNARTPLPVTLVGFRATAVGSRVELSWETAQELNNRHFELERSADGRNYAPIGRVAGAGNSSVRRSYRHLDTQPLPGLSYYRLRQVDQDGTTTLSEAVTVQRGHSAAGAPVATLFPNPNDGAFTVRLTQPASAGAQLQLLDLSGRVVLTQAVGQGIQELPISARHLPAGVYQLRVSSAEGSTTTKMVVR